MSDKVTEQLQKAVNKLAFLKDSLPQPTGEGFKLSAQGANGMAAILNEVAEIIADVSEELKKQEQ